MNDINRIIYGKNPTTRIVALECNNNTVELFQEDEQGNVSASHIDASYFILTRDNILPNSRRLKGQQHYKYGWKGNKYEWYQAKSSLYKKQADFYTVNNLKENFMVRTGHTYFKGMKHTEPTVLSFDIETNGLVIDSTSILYLISNSFRKNGIVTRRLFSLDEYPSEKEMLEDWCSYVRECNPSQILGHNINGYDLPFINQVALNNKTELRLGRNGSVLKLEDKESKFRVDQTRDIMYRKPSIYGREIVDTLFIASKINTITHKYDTLALKSIIKSEGLEQANRVFYDAATIRNNIHIPEELEKIKAYAITDADDALNLYTKLIAATFYGTQSFTRPFQAVTESATGSLLNGLFVRSYLQEGYSIPKADPKSTESFEGALSWGNPGIYSNIQKWDVSALYPSLMIQYGIYPKSKDTLGNIISSLKYFREARLLNKKLAADTGDEYYSNLEQLNKTMINSYYGLLGCNGLNFNDFSAAAEVTKKGRELLNFAIKWATNKSYEEWNASIS